MKLSPELEAKVLELAGEQPAPKGSRRRKPDLVAGSFAPPGTWVVPVETQSEANGRRWRGRSNRTQAARKAVSRAFGPTLNHLAPFAGHYHRGGALRVVLTRIGGPRLDRSNLPTALKAVEDALCLMLGADDGDDRWRPDWGQEPGAGPVGVRVELYRLGK